MIKVVICDGDGTVGFPDPSPEMCELVNELPALGIELAVATNTKSQAAVRRNFRRARLPEPSYIATRRDLRKRKPSPEFVYHIRDLAGVELNEMVYIGDNQVTDIFCAINANVLPFAALYASPDIEYGVPVEEPEAFFQYYLPSYGKQEEPYFGWQFNGYCHDTDNPIEVYASFGDHGSIGLTDHLTAVLKDEQDPKVGPADVSVKSILYHYLLNEVFLSGLRLSVDWITVYPGHRAGSLNAVLQDISGHFSKLFRRTFIQDLLLRHSDAPQSRRQREARNIYDQFRTVLVNPNYRGQLEDKTVLVLDDFTTTGYSLETARRMLLQAGADHVIGLAVGKWRYRYSVSSIQAPWDAYEPCSLSPDEIVVTGQSGQICHSADQYFKDHIWSLYAE